MTSAYTTLIPVTHSGGELAYFTGLTPIDETGNGIRVGDTVTQTAYTDHRGIFHAPVTGLLVVEIERHVNKYVQYERVRATRDDRTVYGNATGFSR